VHCDHAHITPSPLETIITVYVVKLRKVHVSNNEGRTILPRMGVGDRLVGVLSVAMESHVLNAYASALHVGACLMCFTTLRGSYISRHCLLDASHVITC
jgi:hypothetical protein